MTEPAHTASPHYEFIKLLGRGGMAEVLLAHKIAPGGAFKEVAFKRILPDVMREPARIARFMDEIALAAALVHPNVVGVYHWGAFEADHFIEMEYVRGVTLAELLEDPNDEDAYLALPPVEVALIGAMMADALFYAHTFERGDVVGVVHRDISPDNVMLTLDGTAKVLDFGIAKALKGEDRIASETQTAAGKPLYHPPEQWRGKGVDARTDLYALGTTLVLALTGQQLFAPRQGETFESIVYRVFQADRPCVADIAPPGSPTPLVELLEQLVQVDIEARPANAREVARALTSIAHELSSGDSYAARDALAARVRAGYGGDSDTTRALQPPQFATADVIKSTRRPIDPATRADRPLGTPNAGRTAPLPGGAVPAVAVASASAGSSAHREASTGSRAILWAALAGSTLTLVVVAGLVGFLFGGSSAEPTVAPDPEPAPVALEATSTPVAAPPARPAPLAVEPPPAPLEAAVDDTPDETPAADEPSDEAEEATPATQRGRTRRRANVRTTPTPEIRSLGGSGDSRGRSRRLRPGSNDFGL